MANWAERYPQPSTSFNAIIVTITGLQYSTYYKTFKKYDLLKSKMTQLAFYLLGMYGGVSC